MLGPIVLGLLCGIRVGELQRLSWDLVNTDTESPFVTITPDMAKKGNVRNVDIAPNATKWLSLVPRREGKIVNVSNYESYRLRFNRLLELSKFGKKRERQRNLKQQPNQTKTEPN